MKKIAGRFAAAIFATLLFASVPAFAGPAQSDIIAAVNAKNYPLAEKLVRQNLAEKPDSPRLHYELGQILSKEGDHKGAANEMSTAQTLDPSLRFANDPAGFQRNLAYERSVTGGSSIVVTGSGGSGSASAPASSGGGHILLIVLLVAAIGGAAFFIVRAMGAKKTAERERNTKLAGVQNVRLRDLERRLNAARTAVLSHLSGAEMAETAARVEELLERVKSGIVSTGDAVPVAAVTLDNLMDSVSAVEAKLPRDLRAAPAATGTTDAGVFGGSVRPAPSGTSTPSSSGSSAWTPSPSYRNTGYAAPQPQPQVVVVQDNSNDLLTGVLIGEAMSSHRDRIVEREVIVERPSYEDRPRRSSSFDSGRDSSPSFDSGRDSSPSFDSGRDDSSGSSSFDSGSDSGGFDSGSDD